MIFLPTKQEEKYIHILNDFYHYEFEYVRLTDTMIKKSIIDANASLRLLFKDRFDIDYSFIKQGKEYKVIKMCKLITDEGLKEVKISFYRPNSKKGDPRFWIYGLKKVLNPDDMFIFTSFNGMPLIIPLKWSFENFRKQVKKVFSSSKPTLSVTQEELVSLLMNIKSRGWIKTRKSGDTGVGFTLESLLGISANSKKEPDYKGIEIKSSRKNGKNTLQTLFSKTPNWNSFKNRGELVQKRGYWDDKNNRYALYMTINAIKPNSKGWLLDINFEDEKIYILQNNERTVYYDFHILEKALKNKHSQTVFIQADVRNRTKKLDMNEEFFFNEAFLCEGSSFSSFISLVEKGLVSLDFAIHYNPATKKTRDHGFLWRMNKQYIPMLFKEHKKIF